MTDFWNAIQNTDKPIFLYGTGNGADRVINTLDALNVKVSGVFVSDGFVRNKTFHGFKIESFSQISERCDDFVVVTCFGTNRPEVIENIKSIAANKTLYVPDLPVFGDGIFNARYCEQNLNRLQRIYDLLADNLSKKTFKQLIKFKLTGDFSCLEECEADKTEPFKNLLDLNKNTVFVDLGAYRGDTILEYLNTVGDFKKAYAVEPDPKTYKKLLLSVPEKVVCINAAVGEKQGVCYFENEIGRGGHVAKSGVETAVVSVDSMLEENEEYYIKYDVEGAEKSAIKGSEITIKNKRPKLCVASYHRAYDLLDIPEQVLSVNSDYKVYLRHFPHLMSWDTNYYFV